MIIRKTGLLRMNTMSILSILIPVSSLRKAKMIKVFKTLKEITPRSMSSLRCAFTM